MPVWAHGNAIVLINLDMAVRLLDREPLNGAYYQARSMQVPAREPGPECPPEFGPNRVCSSQYLHLGVFPKTVGTPMTMECCQSVLGHECRVLESEGVEPMSGAPNRLLLSIWAPLD